MQLKVELLFPFVLAWSLPILSVAPLWRFLSVTLQFGRYDIALGNFSGHFYYLLDCPFLFFRIDISYLGDPEHFPLVLLHAKHCSTILTYRYCRSL